MPAHVSLPRTDATAMPQAARMRRVCGILTGVTSIALLGACSGLQVLPPGAEADNKTVRMTPAEMRAYARSTQAARAAVANGRPGRASTMTAQSILTEWGTLPLAKGAYRRGAPAGVAHVHKPIMLPEPDYSLSLQEIMAGATCHACDDKPYHRQVMQAADRYGVPAALIHAVIEKESGYNSAATSQRRARGLMQLTPETGREMGVADSRRLYDPQTNIDAGTAYIKRLMASHDTLDEVLAAYNSGPANVRKYQGVPPFNETRRYVREVKRLLRSSLNAAREE